MIEVANVVSSGNLINSAKHLHSIPLCLGCEAVIQNFNEPREFRHF